MDKDKLEHFFRNRVNDFDSTGDNWDLPDPSVFQNAQAYFPEHPRKEKRNRKMIFIFFAIGILLSLLGYIFYLKKNVNSLESELQIAHTEIKKLNNKFTDLENTYFKEGSTQTNKTFDHSHVDDNSVREQRFAVESTPKNPPAGESIVPPLTDMLKSGTTFSSADKGWGLDSITASTTATTFNKATFSKIQHNSKSSKLGKTKQEQKITLLPIRSFQLSKIDKAQLTYSSIIDDIIPNKRKRGKLEVGLSYASVNYKIPLEYELDKLEPTKDEGKNFFLKTNGLKFDLAYHITHNFWITTGVRRTSGAIEKWYFTKFNYDKEKEYIDSDGKTINEFGINTKSGFGDAGNQLNFEIPEGEDIENGEFLNAKWNYYQKFSFTQIPVGINYLFGKNKLQLLLKGGVGWNRVSLGEYFVEASLEYDGKNLPIDKNEKDKNSKESSQFVNGYGGIGLNYQLTSNWNVRTSFTFEKNLIQPKGYLGSNNLASIFDLGIYYRF